VIASAPITFNAFLRPHLAEMSKHFSVTAVCNGNYSDFLGVLPQSIDFYPIKIMRKISIFFDFIALVKIIYLFILSSPLVVHSVTPKAGLLSMIGGWVARVPLRIHVFTGQVWVTKKGLSRLVFRATDKLTAFFSTHVLTDSNSQREFLISEGICSANKILVLADGSISGVDLQRFKVNQLVRTSIRNELSINQSDIVILFVGRLNKDKGIIDLARAFDNLSRELSNLKLIIVGPEEDNVIAELKKINYSHLNKINLIGMSNRPEDYMSASDIMVLPSYREGFGSVIIEAAACGIPSVASRIYGITDAIDDGKSGLLHEPGNVDDLTAKLKKIILNDELRIEMGRYAKLRVENLFSVNRLVQCQIDFYFKAIDALKNNKKLALQKFK